MSLEASLALVIMAFAALMATVLTVALRERRRVATIATDARAQSASDARVLFVIFAAIPGGMLLTLLVAWLVFL
jgi:hypothetical protein